MNSLNLARFLFALVVSSTLLSATLSVTSSRRLQETTTASSVTYPSHCRAGCLICSTKDMCLLCDLSLYYLPHGYDCKLNVIENCDKTNDGEVCLHCKTGFFLDLTTKKCTAVTTTIASCIYYSAADACSLCEKQFYFDSVSKTCLKSSNFIENCEWYTADSTCSACAVGKVATNKNSCVTNPLFTNCIFYTGNLSCYQCITGYTLYSNKYLFDMDTSDVLAKNFFKNDLKNNNTHNWFMVTPDDVCLISVTNCERFNYFNECSKCLDGFFVGTDGGCIKNPLTKIPFCLQYKTAIECISCMKGYYLVVNECVKQNLILGCVVYSITSQGVCDECNPDSYFDSASNTCKKRELSIKNCNENKPDSDKCKTCAESYILSNSDTECSSAISKCTNYYFLPTPDGGQRTVCQSCLDGFYLRTEISGADIITSCELPSPSILGCIVYTSNDYCSKCTTGYYLANGKCHTHNSTIIEKLQCIDYSTIRLNECSVCPVENYLYTLYNYCENLTTDELIANCEQYDTNKNCYQCKDPYYVQTSIDQQTGNTVYTCIHKKISNCTVLDRVAPKCLNCEMAVSKIPNINANNNYCVSLPDFQKKNCTGYQLESTNLSPQCLACEAPYYPISWPDLHYGLCADPLQIKFLYYEYTDEDIVTFANCEILDLKQTKKCRKCGQALVGAVYKNLISTSYSCSTACTSEEVIETFGFDSSIAAPVSYMACKTKLLVAAFGELDNCARIDYDNSSKSDGNFLSSLYPICVQCDTGYLGAINSKIESKYVVYDYQKDWAESALKETAGFKEQGFWNPHTKIPGFYYCIKFDEFATYTTKYFVGSIPATNFPSGLGESRTVVNADYNTSTKSFIQHCNTLLEKDLRYGCGSCKFGYRGLWATDTGGSDYDFIISCTAMTDCDSTVVYTAIGGHDTNGFLQEKVTCHKCTTAGNIPTITSKVINSTVSASPKQFFTTECMPAGEPNTVAGSDVAFITNCGVQEIVKGIPQWLGYKDEYPHPNPVCIACLPGYRPQISATVSNGSYSYISYCSLIDNCVALEENLAFNQCSKCLDGFVFLYDATAKGLSHYHTCVANGDTHCLIGELNNKCYKCKSQYYLNIDNHCDLLEVDGCTAYGNLHNFTSSFDFLGYNPFGNGCLNCDAATVNVRMPYTQTSCLKSLSTGTDSTSLSPKYFVKFCNKYTHDINFGIKCTECQTGYKHSNDDKYCVPDTTVDKCLIYEASSGGTVFTCFQCEDYYYLDNNVCHLGKIMGCITYNNQFTCIKCQENNIPTRIRNGQFTICFNREQSLLNCLDIDSNEGFKGVISCLKCSNTTYPILFDLSIKTCARFYKINFCVEYHTEETFSDSSFYCNKCELEYYANQNKFPNECEQRAYFPIPNCLTYEMTSDKCQVCIENFYLGTNGLTCEPNPIGMVGCVEFKSIDKCKICNNLHFQFNNECKPVPTLIGNCEIYESETVCQLCAKGYNILGEKCSITEIENCITVGYNGVCDVCQDGFKFFVDKCEAVSLANCQSYINKNECFLCDANYYLSSGRCFEVDVIANCTKNKDKDHCELCSANYALSEDQKSCIEMTVDEKALYKNNKCSNYQQVNTCVQCGQGFYFSIDNSECSSCATGSNCAYCDFKDPSKCIMCKSSFFMTVQPNNECISNSVLDVIVATLEEVIPDIYIDSSTAVVSVIVSLMLAVLAM